MEPLKSTVQEKFMSRSSTPEWKLKSFDWLPLDRWTADRLLNERAVNGKRYCKVCDEWVESSHVDSHADRHKREEESRRIRAKETALEKAHEARALKRKEKQMETLADTHTEVNEETVSEAPVSTPARRQVELALPEGEFTIAQLAEENGVATPLARAFVKQAEQSGTLVVRGQAKTGKRGRPALVYAAA
jgi:hypothetical protein